ncbi:MAG: histidine kinase [Methylotenera sp.]|nr:histidine kinase [Methylotenera sp.]
MNLKFRLNLIITLLLLLVMLAGAFTMVRNAREDVRAEVNSTALLALHLLDAEILHYTSDYSWLNGVNQNKASIFRLQSLENVRHLRIEFFDARGNLRDSNRLDELRDTDSAPDWFVKSMDVVSSSMQPIRRQVFANGRLLGELVVTPDPSYEIAEIWNDTLGLLILVAVFFVVVNGMIYIAVGHALRPVDKILDALTALEQGHLDARLPKFTLPELMEISQKFNTMAETLQNSIRNNHRLAQQMIRLQEDERKSLARDLHDEIGQHLTAIHIDASTILNAKKIDEVKVSAQAIDVVARQMMMIVHRILQNLRPGSLDQLGLGAALKDLIDSWRHRNAEVEVDFASAGNFTGVDETVAIAIYRIVQECLTNISRHSAATMVEIKIHRNSDRLDLMVYDNGVGFDVHESSGGFGLAGMRERVQGLNGHFEMETSKGVGVLIKVTLPFIKKVNA